MDPTTQSTQITSSQGLADGQNSAAKDSKLSDKRVVLGADKPSDIVDTSLRFSSQPDSFSPGNYGSEAGPPDGQPDSPIKTSPVSERIKALEALAAKKKEPDVRSDGGFPHFKERHYEKSPTEPMTSSFQKKQGSADHESPESPFEVLGDLRQGSDFEDTADWMKAHLPPVPHFDDNLDLSKGTAASEKIAKSKEMKGAGIVIPDVPAAFAGVPDAFMDFPVEAPKLKDKFSEPPKQPSVEEEFDLNFLPTAYMWDQQEKSGAQAPPNLDSELPASPAPPKGFDSPSPPLFPPAAPDAKQKASDAKTTLWSGDLDPPETGDSSGESDDTVIEDAAAAPAPPISASSVPAPSNDPTPTPAPAPAPSAPSLPADERETPQVKPEKKLMQVPTINVIETDEPNYSDEDMEMEPEEDEDEGYEVVKDPAKESPNTPKPQPEVTKTEPPKTRPMETEFIEGYSPPSSPVDSDAEYSPKHKILKSEAENVQESASKTDRLQNSVDSKGPSSNLNQVQSEKSQTTPNESNDKSSPVTAKPSVANEEVDFPDNDDEWSDEAQDIVVKPGATEVTAQGLALATPSKAVDKINTDVKQGYMETVSLTKSTFMQDDVYDRQSFDDDYDTTPALDDMLDEKALKHAKEPSQILIETLSANTTRNDIPKDIPDLENITSLEDEDGFPKPVGGQPCPREYPKDPYSAFQSEPQSSVKEPMIEMKTDKDVVSDDLTNTKLLPQQEIGSKTQNEDAKAGQHTPDTTSDPESIDPDCSVSGATDSFVEFMRECLKSKQDEEPEDLHQRHTLMEELPTTGAPPSQSPPAMVMDIEQERLTINALKELGSSQEEEEDLQPSVRVSDQDVVEPSIASKLQSSVTSSPNPPAPQTNPASDSTYSKEVEAIDVWVAEAYHLAEHVLTAILTHLSVNDLIHWRDPKKSGVVFGVSMLVLLSLAAFSVISVVSYLLLALLCVTITFRIYKSVVQAVQKSSDGHPFKTLMDKDVSIPPETFRKHVDGSLAHINRALKQMSRLFLVEDLVDSLKLAVVMWLFTYVGAVFNGITILILADILLFAVPPVYEKNKTQIDQYIDLVRTQVNTTIAKLQEKLPGAVKRSKTE